MTNLLLVLGLGFGLCVALTPLVRAAAQRWGLLDHPDGRRKLHARPTPVAGGLAVLAAAAGALLGPVLLGAPLPGEGPDLAALVLAAAVICAVGLADDCFGLRPLHKLLGQGVAVALVLASGLSVQSVRLFHWQVELGLLAVPFTAFWLLGAINSLNLLDGMDGLLGCVGLIVSAALAAMAVLNGQWAAACAAAALAGALLGFLCYNLPPASIFLGDTGSMLIGLVVGVLAIQSSLKGPATVALAAPLAVLIIPIFDTTAAILRRQLSGRSIAAADRGHLHHCLLRRGLSSRRVLACVGGACLLAAAGALASLALNDELFALLTAAAVVGIFVAARLFGHTELRLAGERLASLAAYLRPLRPAGARLQPEVCLKELPRWPDLWSDLTVWAAHLNLQQLCLHVGATPVQAAYHARWDCHDGAAAAGRLWQVEIALAARGQPVGRLEVTGRPSPEPVRRKLARLARLMEGHGDPVVSKAA